MTTVYSFLCGFLAALFLTVLFMRLLLPILRRRHVGQRILEIGPSWHSVKEGTPTMGGLSFLGGILLSVMIAYILLIKVTSTLFLRPLIFAFLYALLTAFVGLIDDLTKFRKKQNEGLTPSQKIVLQIAFAAAYLALLRIYGYIDTAFYIPYFNTVVDFGLSYYFFALILCVGTVNCVNLTDGIDGLCSTVTLIVGAFFALAAATLSNESTLVLSAAIMGGCLAFLFFNRHPAKVFMGDTGSLFLGGTVVGCAFTLDSPLLLLIVGLPYLFEGVSVILQVGYYKLTKKRLFRMAPFHHHLEKCGWSEGRIVTAFALGTVLLGFLAFFGVK